jgi:hypothetical protein
MTNLLDRHPDRGITSRDALDHPSRREVGTAQPLDVFNHPYAYQA